MTKDLEKAAQQMQDSMPQSIPLREFILVGGTAFHAGLIEYQQKHYVSLQSENKRLIEENKKIEESNKLKDSCMESMLMSYEEIVHMGFFQRLKFFITGNLPKK